MAIQIHKAIPFLLSATLKLPVLMAVFPGVVTETSLEPSIARLLIVILAVIWLELLTVKLLTVIPEPELTACGSGEIGAGDGDIESLTLIALVGTARGYGK